MDLLRAPQIKFQLANSEEKPFVWEADIYWAII